MKTNDRLYFPSWENSASLDKIKKDIKYKSLPEALVYLFNLLNSLYGYKSRYLDGTTACTAKLYRVYRSITDFFFFARRFIPRLKIKQVVVNILKMSELANIELYFCHDISKYVMGIISLNPGDKYSDIRSLNDEGLSSTDIKPRHEEIKKIWDSYLRSVVKDNWEPLK